MAAITRDTVIGDILDIAPQTAPAFLATLAGWLVMQLLSRLAQRPLTWMASRLWSLATGRPTMVTARDILAGTPITPVSRPKKVAP